MLLHPDAHKVFNSPGHKTELSPEELRRGIRTLYSSSPLIWRDLLGYARAGLRTIDVVKVGDVYKFDIKD